MNRNVSFALAGWLAIALTAEAYEIGEDLEAEAFWKSDPVLFVKRHAGAGFEFTSDQRAGADSRQDGGVTCYGLPVYESKIVFGEAGGIDRVELMLFATAGTETIKEVDGDDGQRYRKRVRLDKTITKDGFGAILKAVRDRLTKKGAKQPATSAERTKDAMVHQARQIWSKTEIPIRATLTWNYTQVGKKADTFAPGFIRLAVDGPSRAGGDATTAKGRGAPSVARGAARISDNIVRDPRGDVFIDNIPMVDQGQKGYCAVATAERVLRYYGVEVDEHEIAQAAGTSAEGGTSTKAMKDSVEAIGKRFKLGTVVCYGDFDKSAEERIAGICDEVRAYNKAAKKLKKPTIADDVYISHRDNTTYYSPAAADAAMDAEVLKEMKVNGAQKSRFTRFMKDVRDQIGKGIPLYWGVKLGTYPEPGLMQANGWHIRLVIGYNDKTKEILYSDSWGAGHELKRMPAEWAWTISHCLMYMKPLVH